MVNKILVALNTNEPYEHIFQQALDLAIATGAELVLLNVHSSFYDYTVPIRYYPGVSGYPLTMEDSFWSTYLADRIDAQKNVRQLLSKLTDQATAHEIESKLIQAEGDPGVTICNTAKSEKADLIVVGSHGRKGFDELLIGSISSYVMHRAGCSVLIVHNPKLSEQQDDKAAATSAATSAAA